MMRSMFELDEIATFVRVVQAHGFSAAAKLLGVPKSTVSRRVARLEERLGVRLLHRTTRRMRPTPEGQAFFDRVAPAVATLQNAAIETAEGKDEPRGQLSISVPFDLGQHFLSEIVASFVATYPKVQVRVGVTGEFVDLVRDGYDVAIRAGRLSDTSLVARRLGTIPFWLMASPSYLETHGEPVEPEELSEHAFLAFSPPGQVRGWTLEGGPEPVTLPTTGPVMANELSFLVHVAIAGGGIALLPVFQAKRELASGRLKRVLPNHQVPGSPLQLVYPSARQLPAKVVAFRDHLLEALSDELWTGTGAGSGTSHGDVAIDE